jgi:hypothetical protein
MPKFLIHYDIGFGDNYQVVECSDEEKATKIAYEAAMEDVEGNYTWQCIGLATPELLEEYGVEDDA